MGIMDDQAALIAEVQALKLLVVHHTEVVENTQEKVEENIDQLSDLDYFLRIKLGTIIDLVEDGEANGDPPEVAEDTTSAVPAQSEDGEVEANGDLQPQGP